MSNKQRKQSVTGVELRDIITFPRAAPLEIWEGSVISVDMTGHLMQVELIPKIGNMPRHTAEIDLEWVSEQDKELVKPGAIFYLTLFKRSERSGVENAQELRFRRRPSWSHSEIQQIDKEAKELLSRMRPLAIRFN